MNLKLKIFLKPNFKKVAVFVALVAISLLSMWVWAQSGSGFGFESYLPIYLSIPLSLLFYLPLFVWWCVALFICGGMGCPNGDEFEKYADIAGYIISAIITWLFVCLVVMIWNKIFGFLDKRQKFWEAVVAIIILGGFIFVGIIMPLSN